MGVKLFLSSLFPIFFFMNFLEALGTFSDSTVLLFLNILHCFNQIKRPCSLIRFVQSLSHRAITMDRSILIFGTVISKERKVDEK